MNTKILIVPIAAAVLLQACGKPPEQEARYGTAQVEQRDIVVSVEAAGVIEPETTVELKSKASGEVLSITAETGAVVEAGELIVQIDKRTPRNALGQAQAELEAAMARRDIAKTQRNRAEKLLKSGTFNQVDYESSVLEYANAKAEVVRAEVAVENARIALDDTEVRAPITGTVIERTVEKGQVISSPTTDVSGGTVLLKMADLRSVQVKALVDETDIGKITAGQAALVTVAAYPNQPFEGRVLKIEPKAEEETTVTMFSVLVTINNEQGLLRPGMNAEVNINIASSMDVAAVPTMALRTMRDVSAAEAYLGMAEDELRDALKTARQNAPSGSAKGGEGYRYGGTYWLLVERGDTLVPVFVETGITDLDYSEIVAGVNADETIVLLPSSGLIQSQERFKKFMGQIGGVPGMNGSDDKKGSKGKKK